MQTSVRRSSGAVSAGGAVHPHPSHRIGGGFPGHRVKDPVKVKPAQGRNIRQRVE